MGLFVKISTKLELMFIGFRDAPLCVSLRPFRRHPVAETCRRLCHEHSCWSFRTRYAEYRPTGLPQYRSNYYRHLINIYCIYMCTAFSLFTQNISLITKTLKKYLIPFHLWSMVSRYVIWNQSSEITCNTLCSKRALGWLLHQ